MTKGMDENEPLIGKSVSYSAASTHEGTVFIDDTYTKLDDTHGTNGTYGTNGTHGTNGSKSPPSGVDYTISTDRITYTWHEMNVFTSAVEQKRRRCWGWPQRRSPGEEGPPLMKHILKNVSGAAYPGELLAIMGASGAGKTTLLNTLMFRSPSSLVVSGRCAMNGVPVSSSALSNLSAYVQQDDLFIGTLTVKEHLIFQALVGMDRDIPYSQRIRRVEEVISELSLTECQNTIIGITGRIKGISGGEKKRLSFASKVLTNPPLMFCDEPTSGLDLVMAQNVVTIMKNMALKGKTIVATIHQPSSQVFAMFDKVLLMTEGRVAFLGTTQEACELFKELGSPCPSNYNPADFFIEMLAVVPTNEQSCRDSIEMVCDTFNRSEAGIRLSTETELSPEIQAKMEMSGIGTWGDDFMLIGGHRRFPYKASWVAQFRAVLWRSWLSVMKEPILIKVRLLQAVMSALLVGFIYFHQQNDQVGIMNINGALFIFLINITYQNTFAVLNVFCSELPVFMREHLNSAYRVDVYFLCKTLAEVPIFVIIPILYITIAYYLVGLNSEIDCFFTAMLIIVLVSNVSTSFGYLISCFSTGVTMALSFGPSIINIFFILGGFFMKSGSEPVFFKLPSALSWFKYGNEALLINQWEDVESIDCHSKFNNTCLKNGHAILEKLNFAESDFVLDICALIGLIIGFKVIAFIALLSRTFRSD